MGGLKSQKKTVEERKERKIEEGDEDMGSMQAVKFESKEKKP